MRKTLKKDLPTYNCPFCKHDILFSKKTEIYYRNVWVDGCCECFALSISEVTTAQFQSKDY
jgi:hypothetical protein